MPMEDNTPFFLSALERATYKALEEIGTKAEKYASALCPVGTPESTGKKGYRGGTLRRSITHEVDMNKKMVQIGSNVVYAPYVELGTGPYFKPPPEWEQFETKRGESGGTGYVKPRPYLQPAIRDHMETYKSIIERNLRDAD